MANAAVMIKWGNPFVGREAKSLEVFMQAVEYFGGLVSSKKIEAHRTYIAQSGDFSALGGFMLLEGEVDQLRKVLDSEEYRTLNLKARHLVDRIDEVHCLAGNEIGNEVARIQKIRKELGIV
jgi:hypothetical protein